MNDLDFQIYDVENELEKRRRPEPETAPTVRSKAKLSFGKMAFYFFLGLVIFKLCGELLNFLF